MLYRRKGSMPSTRERDSGGCSHGRALLPRPLPHPPPAVTAGVPSTTVARAWLSMRPPPSVHLGPETAPRGGHQGRSPVSPQQALQHMRPHSPEGRSRGAGGRRTEGRRRTPSSPGPGPELELGAVDGASPAQPLTLDQGPGCTVVVLHLPAETATGLRGGHVAPLEHVAVGGGCGRLPLHPQAVLVAGGGPEPTQGLSCQRHRGARSGWVSRLQPGVWGAGLGGGGGARTCVPCTQKRQREQAGSPHREAQVLPGRGHCSGPWARCPGLDILGLAEAQGKVPSHNFGWHEPVSLCRTTPISTSVDLALQLNR